MPHLQNIPAINKYIGYIIILILTYTTTLAVEKRWAETDVWVANIVRMMYIISLIGIVLKQRIKVTVTDVIVLTWFAYYAISTWISNEYPCRTEFLKTTEMFLLYCALRIVLDGTKIPEWILTASIMAGGAYESVLGAWQMANGTSRHSMYMLTGNFLNPGPYSAYLMTGLATGLAAIRYVRSKNVFNIKIPAFVPQRAAMPLGRCATILGKITTKHLLLTTMAPMAIILPATWSRAAFAGVAVIGLWIYRRHYHRYRYAVLGTLAVAAIWFYLVKQGSADGRLIIWRAATTMWCDSPLSGVGTGGFCHAVAEGMAQLHGNKADLASAGVTDNAYNILLKILVEHGIAGAMFAISLCLAAMVTLRRNSRPLFYGMTALLIFSMFSYPFDMLPYKIIAVMTVAWSEATSGKTVIRLGKTTAVLIAGCLVFVSKQTYGMVKESYYSNNEYSVYRGSRDDSFINDYYKLLPQEGDNAEMLFDFGMNLREAGRYNDSNAMFYRGTLCSADPMFYVLMGNNYKDMKQYKQAEKAYMKAFAIMPNRVYPLYKLMLLHQETGNMDKVKDMAKRIINMKPKIESPATKEMREKAIDIMNDGK